MTSSHTPAEINRLGREQDAELMRKYPFICAWERYMGSPREVMVHFCYRAEDLNAPRTSTQFSHWHGRFLDFKEIQSPLLSLEIKRLAAEYCKENLPDTES